MSTAAAVTAGLAALEAAGPLISKIVEWAEQGLSDEEIQSRLAAPDDVGKDLIANITKRKKRGRDLLGRDPNPG